MQATARRVDTAGGGAKRVTAAGSAETGASPDVSPNVSPNVSPDAALDAPVDLVHLARHTLGNRDLEREVLRLFVLQSRMLLERMSEAGGETGDEAALARLLHTLLGSARGIGAWQVARSVERQQEALDAGLSPDLADVGAAVAAAGVFIEDILRG